jgi:hypothetical protein
MFKINNSLRKFCSIPRLCETQRFITVLADPITDSCKWMLSVGSAKSRTVLRFGWSVPFIGSVKLIGPLWGSQTQPTALANEPSLYAHTMFQIYASPWMVFSLPRFCETLRFITVLRDWNYRPFQMNPVCRLSLYNRWIRRFDCLFPACSLWNTQVHYCAHRPNHQPLQMKPVCRLTLCSRPTHRFELSVPFLASVKPRGSLLCSQTHPTSLANESSL